MATAPNLPLITAEEFFAMPEPVGDFTYELHFGELVKVSRPKKGHCDLQERIREILARKLDSTIWKVLVEMSYGLTAGYDVRAADVGVCLHEKWDAVPDDGYLIGSPDLVVQVKSRSNRDQRMEEDAITHITHGATAVMLVRPVQREITLATASSRNVFGSEDTIQLPAPLSAEIAVNELFLR